MPDQALVAAMTGQVPPVAAVSEELPDGEDPAAVGAGAGTVPLSDFVDEQPAIETAITMIRMKKAVLNFTGIVTPWFVTLSDRDRSDRVAP